MLIYPGDIRTDGERYRHVYSALEALRLKHNTRAGDVSAEAVEFRAACMKEQRKIVADILELRPKITTPAWTPKDEHDIDPLRESLKADGKADHAAADLKTLTGTDLDAVAIGVD